VIRTGLNTTGVPGVVALGGSLDDEAELEGSALVAVDAALATPLRFE
jgi:hypothetical protein